MKKAAVPRRANGRPYKAKADATAGANVRQAKRRPAKRKALAPSMHGGPAAHKEAVSHARKTEEISARRKVAWDLFVAGATLQQIADHCRVSTYTSHGDVYAVKEGLKTYGLHDADLLRARQQEGLDAVRRAHWPHRAKKANADVIVRTFERESRLQGIDVERDHAPTIPQLEAFMGALLGAVVRIVSNETERRLVLEEARRLSGTVISLPPAGPGPEGVAGG